MAMTKQAHQEALKKIAAIDERDQANAFEAGFAKCASDMGLTQAEYEAFRAEALAELEKPTK